MTVETPAKLPATLEEAVLLMSQVSANLEKNLTEMSRRMAESKAENEAKIAEANTAFLKRMAESKAENEAKIAEMNTAFLKRREEAEAKIAEMNAAFLKKREEDRDVLDKWIGYFGNSIGNIVEMVLIPGIKKKINDFGHSFNSLSPRKQFYNTNGKTYAEVDLFLENGEEVMVVEVKTKMSVKEVERQIKRLELLRKNEAGSLKGKIIYSAVAGLQIDEDAREMALGLGMYVVEMVEDTKSVNVIKPSGKLGTW